MRVWKKRAWESKNRKKQKKNKKNNFAWTYPRFFSQNCFFWLFCFFWFSSSFWTSGLGRGKNLEKNQKKQKKTILHGLTQDSSHRIVFFVFFGCFGCLRVFGQVGLGEQKTSRNTKKKQKTKKTILHGLTQDSSHRIVFFGFLWVVGHLESWKTQRSQRGFLESISYVPTSLGRSADILTFHCHFGAAAAFVPRPVVVPMKPKKVR